MPDPTPARGRSSSGTLAVSWGRPGGFYLYRGFNLRLCMGRLAFTYCPVEIDDLMEAYVETDSPLHGTQGKDQR